MGKIDFEFLRVKLPTSYFNSLNKSHRSSSPWGQFLNIELRVVPFATMELASKNLWRVLEPWQILTCEHSQIPPLQVNFNLRVLTSRLNSLKRNSMCLVAACVLHGRRQHCDCWKLETNSGGRKWVSAAWGLWEVLLAESKQTVLQAAVARAILRRDLRLRQQDLQWSQFWECTGSPAWSQHVSVCWLWDSGDLRELCVKHMSTEIQLSPTTTKRSVPKTAEPTVSHEDSLKSVKAEIKLSLLNFKAAIPVQTWTFSQVSKAIDNLIILCCSLAETKRQRRPSSCWCPRILCSRVRSLCPGSRLRSWLWVTPWKATTTLYSPSHLTGTFPFPTLVENESSSGLATRCPSDTSLWQAVLWATSTNCQRKATVNFWAVSLW